MGIILLAVFICVELFFLFWVFSAKRNLIREKSIAWLILFALFVVLSLTGVIDWSFRYYALGFFLLMQATASLAVLLSKKRREKKYSAVAAVASFIGAVLLYVFLLIPAIIFPQFEPIEPTGSLTVKTSEFIWVDEERTETFTDTGEKRFVNGQFYYPEEQGKYPLVVFSHGAFGFSGSNDSTYMDLASNGYVVASVSHPYHAFYARTLDNEFKVRHVIADRDFINSVYEVNNIEDGPEQQAIIEGWLSVRVPDLNFVLDHIIELATEQAPSGAAGEISDMFGKIDIEKIGLFGHSLGGAASVELGRLRDDVDAIIDLDGSMTGDILSYENGKAVFDERPYPVPLLDVYAEDHFKLAQEAGESYVNFHLAARAKEYYRAVLEGSGHMNFTDLPLFSPHLAKILGSGEIDAREGIEKMNGWVLEFFNYTLKDGPAPKF